jgi:hypothetical protein
VLVHHVLLRQHKQMREMDVSGEDIFYRDHIGTGGSGTVCCGLGSKMNFPKWHQVHRMDLKGWFLLVSNLRLHRRGSDGNVDERVRCAACADPACD